MSGGFTLIEALLASVVLAMAIGAVIMPFSTGAANTAQNARSTLAVNLAQDLMEEILDKPFSDPDGEEVGERERHHWDDMDDYDGYFENVGNIAGFDGVRVNDPAATALSRSAKVESIYMAGQGVPDLPTFLRITVAVCYHDEKVVSLSRLAYENE